jgi:hypothetical protein
LKEGTKIDIENKGEINHEESFCTTDRVPNVPDDYSGETINDFNIIMNFLVAEFPCFFIFLISMVVRYVVVKK